MIFSVFATIFCSLSLTLNGIQNNSSTLDTLRHNEKSVVFEGNYLNISASEAVSEINGGASQDIKISFFVKPSNSLATLKTNRPSISNDNLIDTQEELKEYREKIQENIFSNNLDAYSEISDLFSTDEDVKIETSKVNSLITVYIDSSKVTEELIDNLNENLNDYCSTIDKIYIGNEPRVESLSSLPTTFEKINVDSMVNSGPYDGSGINVGIVEAAAYKNTSGGVIDVSTYGTSTPGYDDYYGRSIKIRPNQTDLSYHADHVAMIAVGNNGIARGSNILSCYDQGGVESYAKWLVDENMNVANGSFGGIEDYGIYPSQSELMDEWINNYLFTFVAAAGNRTYNEDGSIKNNNYVTWPATGYNVISVGNSYESSSTLGSGSCYKEMGGYFGSKPNIIAPGTTTTNSYNPNSQSYSGTGTSYAAPQVTGCIALLMEEFPYLAAYPELVTSIVTSSASPMSSAYNNESGDNHYDGSGLHNQIGSGLLNYEKMREAANQYLSITRPKNSSTGIIPKYIDIVATDEQRIRASSAWLYDKNTFTDYDLELYKLDVDGTMDRVAYIDDSYNNVEFIDFDVKTTGTYRLVINQKEQNVANDFIGLSYVLINDDIEGSTSGAIDTDNSLKSHFEIDRTIYEDYGEFYNNEPITEFEINDGIHTFETTRKRARYTEDGKLVLSAKSNDSNYAYMEYKFDTSDDKNDDWGLYNIKYQFGLWSDDESLIRNSSIDLYGLHKGSWLLIRHFNPKEMSTDPNNLKTYIDCLDFPVNGLRFYVTTNYTNNNNNVGRVVIGNIEGDIHYHIYTKYEQYNDVNHKMVCNCGDYHLGTHTWGPSYWVGSTEYANCIKCNKQHNMNSGGPIVTPIV